MRLKSIPALIISALAALPRFSEATPTLNYAFNSQLPPIARYNEEYHYQLSTDSFTTGDSWMNMWGENLPDWLKFDGDSRTLSGTPEPENDNYDDQTISFRLVAQDSSGNAYCDCTLVVSNVPAPKESNLPNVLKDSGNPLAGGNNLVLTPGKNFEVDFTNSFFQKAPDATRDIIGYFGKMADHSPLPNWINFDGGNAKFYGTAPSVNSQIAPAQGYPVSLLVSDYDGYSSNEVKFNLLVGAHQFTTNLTIDNINATKGKNIRYQIPFDKFSLDDGKVQVANISSIKLNTTDSSWLKLDKSTGVITGTPPKSLKENEKVEIEITDSFGDKISYGLKISVGKNSTSIFSSNTLGRVNATQGGFFEYSLKDVLLNPDVKITPSYSPKVDWIKFHTDNNTFTGEVPKSFKQSTITLKAKVEDANQKRDELSSGDVETATLTLTGVPATPKKKHSDNDKSNSKKDDNSNDNDESDSKNGDEENKGPSGKTIAIVCGVVIPICVAIAIGLLILCCRRNRNMKRSGSNGSIHSKDISPPILKEDDFHNKDPEKGMIAPHSVPKAPANLHNKQFSNDEEYESPQKVLALNFMKMDSSGEDVNAHYYSSEETQVGDGLSINSPSLGGNSPAMIGGYSPALANSERPTEGQTGLRGPPLENPHTTPTPPPPAVHAEERDSRVSVRPRNSWRQTAHSGDSDGGRWQEHRSVGSLATISTDELLTMRLVDRQSYDMQQPRNTFMSPTKSTILTPHQSFYPRDDSSGIVQPLGSHSSSLQQEQNYNIHSHSSSDQSGQSQYSMKRKSGGDVDVDYYRDALHLSTATFQSDEESTTHEGPDHYRTASSGTEDEHHLADDNASTDEESLRPYRNSRGEMTWSQRSLDQLAHHGDMTPQPASVDDRQSFGLAITTQDREGGTVARSNTNRDTVRLVQHPERSNLRDLRTPDLEEGPKVEQGSSAELAFL